MDEKEAILSFLRTIREQAKYKASTKLGFAGSHKHANHGNAVRAQLGLFALLTQCKPAKDPHVCFPTKKERDARTYAPIISLTQPYSLRYGLMRVADNHQSMGYDLSYADKVETTCRFLLKACAHALFSPDEPIEITRFLFDGNAHHEGAIDVDRLTRKFGSQLRGYVRLHPALELDDRARGDRDEASGFAIDFADNVVGGWRAIISGSAKTSHITAPLKEILERAKSNKLHVNKNSRWFKRLSLSEFVLQEGQPAFPCIFRPDASQGTLF